MLLRYEEFIKIHETIINAKLRNTPLDRLDKITSVTDLLEILLTIYNGELVENKVAFFYRETRNIWKGTHQSTAETAPIFSY